jgi:DNA topoisomerase-1
VQSVAVKMIVEREREIKNFKPVESWKMIAQLKYQTQNIKAVFTKIK